MDWRKSAALGLLLVFGFSILFLGVQNDRGRLGENEVNATFYDENGSQVSWAVLEVADNDSERSEGLMNVTDLGRNEGMLFVFEDEEPRGFWMKNTLIPLDMIFLNEYREVINVETARPEPGVSEDNLTVYRSERPAKYIVEVNAGFAENFSIVEGSKISWRK